MGLIKIFPVNVFNYPIEGNSDFNQFSLDSNTNYLEFERLPSETTKMLLTYTKEEAGMLPSSMFTKLLVSFLNFLAKALSLSDRMLPLFLLDADRTLLSSRIIWQWCNTINNTRAKK
jgi:hypothetical protein